jgi:hypothetical protein
MAFALPWASPMPNREDLATLGASGATLAIHLSVRNVREIVRELSPHYGADCPAIVVAVRRLADQHHPRHARHHRGRRAPPGHARSSWWGAFSPRAISPTTASTLPTTATSCGRERRRRVL